MRAVLDRRSAIGGTAPARVASEVERWQAMLSAWATVPVAGDHLSAEELLDPDCEEPLDEDANA